MIEQDTIKLLRECDAGVKMGVSAIDDVLDQVESPNLKAKLSTCKKEHEHLKQEIHGLLDQYHDEGKEPPPAREWPNKSTMFLVFSAKESSPLPQFIPKKGRHT